METHLTIAFAPHKTDRQTTAQFAARGLVADTTLEACAQDVELCL